MKARRFVIVVVAILSVGVTACSDDRPTTPQPGASAKTDEFPSFADPTLVQGREVWLAACKPCHAYGVAGAPKIGDRGAWTPRIAQGQDVLHRHALEGFVGPAGTEMPARGGSDGLSDEQVKAAVDYMVAASGS